MLTRILTSAVGVVVFFGALLAPKIVFALAVFAVAAIMLGEMYKVLSCGMALNAAGFAAAAVIAAGTLADNLMPAVVFSVMLYLAAAVILHTKMNAKDVCAHGFITLFLTVFMCYVVKLHIEIDMWGVLWVFIIAWMTDTGAYFSGVFCGKHKLVPHISPKKTVEGAAGGVVICIVSCVVYSLIMGTSSTQECIFFAAMGLAGSVLAQIGDFVASCIKRDYGVKDYGSILPGHGGLMDRFDSVVFIAPFVYCMICYVHPWLGEFAQEIWTVTLP